MRPGPELFSEVVGERADVRSRRSSETRKPRDRRRRRGSREPRPGRSSARAGRPRRGARGRRTSGRRPSLPRRAAATAGGRRRSGQAASRIRVGVRGRVGVRLADRRPVAVVRVRLDAEEDLPSYVLSKPVRNDWSRTARPTQRTRSPVAAGSSVPVCPIRRRSSRRRASSTTSCDVSFSGLSTRRRPEELGRGRGSSSPASSGLGHGRGELRREKGADRRQRSRQRGSRRRSGGRRRRAGRRRPGCPRSPSTGASTGSRRSSPSRRSAAAATPEMPRARLTRPSVSSSRAPLSARKRFGSSTVATRPPSWRASVARTSASSVRSGERLRLEEELVHAAGLRPGGHEARAEGERLRRRVAVAERARVGDERDPEIRRDRGGDRPAEEVEEVGHDLAHGGGREVHEVQRAPERVAGVMVDVRDAPLELVRPARSGRPTGHSIAMSASQPVGQSSGSASATATRSIPGQGRVGAGPAHRASRRALPCRCASRARARAEGRAEGVAVRVPVPGEEEAPPVREQGGRRPR